MTYIITSGEMGESEGRVFLAFLAALCLLGSGDAQRLPKGFANPIDRCVLKFIFF
jgi:hypothetical protein